MTQTAKPRRAAIYIRVSTDGQSTESQLRELTTAAEHRGWEIVQVFEDAGISGAKGRNKRPGLDGLLKAAVRRKFDVAMAWSVDRLGRSLADLVTGLQELHAVGADLYLHTQGVDTTTPAGRAMFQMLGVFAEFEREMIRSRVLAGLATARAKGKRLGRPAVADDVTKAIRVELERGTGILKTARSLGVGTGLVHRLKREMTVVAV